LPIIPNRMARIKSDSRWNETSGKHRRTIYVGMTQAMRSLLVVRPRKIDLALFQGFDDALGDMR